MISDSLSFKDSAEERARRRNQAIKLPSLERADSYGNQRRVDWDSDSGVDWIGSLLGRLFNL